MVRSISDMRGDGLLPWFIMLVHSRDKLIHMPNCHKNMLVIATPFVTPLKGNLLSLRQIADVY